MLLCCAAEQGDLQRLLAQEAALKQQIASMQERQAAAERARAGDRAFLQVGWVLLSAGSTYTGSASMELAKL